MYAIIAITFYTFDLAEEIAFKISNKRYCYSLIMFFQHTLAVDTDCVLSGLFLVSPFVPTNRISAPGQKCRTSGIHKSRAFAKESLLSTAKQTRKILVPG